MSRVVQQLTVGLDFVVSSHWAESNDNHEVGSTLLSAHIVGRILAHYDKVVVLQARCVGRILVHMDSIVRSECVCMIYLIRLWPMMFD